MKTVIATQMAIVINAGIGRTLLVPTT